MPGHFYYKTHCDVTFLKKNTEILATITGPDIITNKTYCVTILKSEYDAIEAGENLQKAVKSIPIEDREFLISGLSPSSFPRSVGPRMHLSESIDKGLIVVCMNCYHSNDLGNVKNGFDEEGRIDLSKLKCSKCGSKSFDLVTTSSDEMD